ncbi:hypothetical protein SESBI_12767 [Sesbania bispinosa]|nr:hypothetical protein SESBI_12767 [Sesbania bispinosa]
MRFPSIYETQSFINALKEILKDEKDPEPLNTDFGSEMSSHSEFISSNKHSHRACEEPSFMTPVDTYIPQMPLYTKNEGEQPSGTQEKETTPVHTFEGILPALPPSFATLLMDCSGINHAQPTVSEETDLKSQIVRYMEDSSFQAELNSALTNVLGGLLIDLLNLGSDLRDHAQEITIQTSLQASEIIAREGHLSSCSGKSSEF